MKKKIHIIINPASGQDEPIVSQLNRAFENTDYDWDISLTKKFGDATAFARKAVRNKYDIVGAYGGDGTIMEVAKGLANTSVPMLIMAGGTANVMAKELFIPVDNVQLLTLLTSNKLIKQDVDMGVIGNKKFLIRINFGIAADMLKEADRNIKKNLGQLAYGVTMVKSIRQAQKHTFTLHLDEKKIVTEGVALVVANSGNIGLPGFSIVPDISVTDGYLDVIVIPQADIKSVAALATGALRQVKPEQALEHWKAKRITVKTDDKISITNDDEEIEVKKMSIKVLPKAVKILVPKEALKTIK